MSAIRQATSKSLMLFSGRAYPELAEEIGGHLGVAPTPTASYEFANGELFVRFEESVRGCDAFVVQSHTAPINEWLMEQFIMVDALKRASAKRITVVAPFYGYARQDKKHRGREPISGRLVAVATHGIMSDPATDRMKNSPIDEIVLTSTLPIPEEKRLDKLTVLS